MAINYSLKASWMLVCFGSAILCFSAVQPKLKPLSVIPQAKPKPKMAQVLPATDSLKMAIAAMSSRIVVDLSEARVYSYWGKELIGTYPVSVGQPGWETPTGTFKVLHKQLNPVWKQPITGQIIPTGPDNPLGDRWIGFWADERHHIGFHGTNNEKLVGKAISHGCLRMRNQDIRVLYNQVNLGTPVIVRP